MKIIEQIKRAIYLKYQTSTLYAVDNIPLYLDHVPQSVKYPIIVVRHNSSGNTMAMPSAVKPNGFDYVDARFRFLICSNDRQHVQLEDIADRLEDLYHRTSLPTSNSVTHIATISVNQQTIFFDEGQKIWSIPCDYRIIAGR